MWRAVSALAKAEWEDASLFFDGPDVNDHAPKLYGMATTRSFTS